LALLGSRLDIALFPNFFAELKTLLDLFLDVCRSSYTNLLKSSKVVPQLVIIYPGLQIFPKLSENQVNLILFATLKIDQSILDFLFKVFRVIFCSLHDLKLLNRVSHDHGIEDMELGEVKVVIIPIQKLECILFVHMAAS
jgi:hypothetical protein